MQKTIENVINAGIALFRAGEGTIHAAVKEVQNSFEDLKEKGAEDKSEAAEKLRSTAEEITSRLGQLAGKAETVCKEGVDQLGGHYNTVAEQIKQILPEDKINNVKGKLDSLRQAVKERVSRPK